MIHLRCSDHLAGIHVTVQCQLLTGHDGVHVAVGSAANAVRDAWTWGTPEHVDRRPLTTEFEAACNWAPGLPRPEFGVSE